MARKNQLQRLKQSSKVSEQALPEENRKQERSRIARRSARMSPLGRRLLQAGFEISPKRYMIVCAVISAAAAYLCLLLGKLLALFVFVALYQYLLFGYLGDRAAKRKKKMLPHLPPFIDALASALGTGYNLELAIVNATLTVPKGVLRTELDRVSNALNLGFPVRDATTLLKERIAGREITSLVVSLNLFSAMGGTVLEPFRRLATKIREQQVVTERANRDLVMVKQAFYMIFCLALGVPLLLSVAQPEYLARAFHDSVGRLILQAGEIMILSSLIIFKQMTNLKI